MMAITAHEGIQYINVHNKSFASDILQVSVVKLRFEVLIFPGHYLKFSIEFLQHFSSTVHFKIWNTGALI